MTDPGPLYQMPPDKWGDDPADLDGNMVWYQAGGRPQRDQPRPPRQPRCRAYLHTTRPDNGVPVVFVPGDTLPAWAQGLTQTNT
jgi:hypothetical protein